MKKRILKLTLALIIILGTALGLVSCSGGATSLPDAESASGGVEGTSITWSYNADNQTLTLAGEGDIPNFAAYENVSWYEVRHSIKKIVLPEGITSIGDHAFYYCPLLEEISIPASVTKFGRLSFAFCSSLKSIEISDKVNSIGENCFEGCSALESIFVPSSVTSIGARAFAHCTSLANAQIMAQLDKLSDRTFLKCTSLEVLKFHKASENITMEGNPFEGASKNFGDAGFTESLTGEQTLTVKYVFENGGTAAEDKVSAHKYGESYSVVSPTIEGYTASRLTVTGEITSDKIETVTYTAVSAETEAQTEPAPETEPTDTEEKDGIGVGGIVAIVIFAVVIVAIAVLAVIMLRSDKKQNGKGAPKRK